MAVGTTPPAINQLLADLIAKDTPKETKKTAAENTPKRLERYIGVELGQHLTKLAQLHAHVLLCW